MSDSPADNIDNLADETPANTVSTANSPGMTADSFAADASFLGATDSDPTPKEPRAGMPSDKAKRLLKLPVTVVVYLAEKKIEVEQLLMISPGALITFNKPCEDLLDLYVNNHRYCRGEAVKIGEKFGIKISEVGVVDVRESPILV